MEITQVITMQTTVVVMINPILQDSGVMTLKADIFPDGSIQYYMFGITVEQVPQPLHPAVQQVLDDFKTTVVQKALDAGHIQEAPTDTTATTTVDPRSVTDPTTTPA